MASADDSDEDLEASYDELESGWCRGSPTTAPWYECFAPDELATDMKDEPLEPLDPDWAFDKKEREQVVITFAEPSRFDAEADTQFVLCSVASVGDGSVARRASLVSTTCSSEDEADMIQSDAAQEDEHDENDEDEGADHYGNAEGQDEHATDEEHHQIEQDKFSDEVKDDEISRPHTPRFGQDGEEENHVADPEAKKMQNHGTYGDDASDDQRNAQPEMRQRIDGRAQPYRSKVRAASYGPSVCDRVVIFEPHGDARRRVQQARGRARSAVTSRPFVKSRGAQELAEKLMERLQISELT